MFTVWSAAAGAGRVRQSGAPCRVGNHNTRMRGGLAYPAGGPNSEQRPPPAATAAGPGSASILKFDPFYKRYFYRQKSFVHVCF